MNGGLFTIGVIVLMVVIFQRVWRRVRGPKLIVRGLLRHYHGVAKTGLPEPECLFRVLCKRSGWKQLPAAFLAEIIARLGSKEEVFRFVSLAEGYCYERNQLPTISANRDLEAAMREIALWLVDFGKRLQDENRLKQAEFVQKLALGFEPEQFFALLPMAMTYYKMKRYEDAAPLFEIGLAQLANCVDGADHLDRLDGGASLDELSARYQELYASCLQTGDNQRNGRS